MKALAVGWARTSWLVPRMRSTSPWSMPICSLAHLLLAGMLPYTSPSKVPSRDLTTRGLPASAGLAASLAAGAGAAATGSAALAVVAPALLLAGSQSTAGVAAFLLALVLAVVFFLALGSGGHSGLLATAVAAGAGVEVAVGAA